jgi:hypothetical protein
LTSQVNYTFKIIGSDEKNKQSDTQIVSITFKDGELKQSKDVSDGVSILLFAPETIYSDMEFLAVAEVLFCNATNQYTYQWQFNDESLNKKFQNIRGKYLKIAPGNTTSKLIRVDVKLWNNEKKLMGIVSLTSFICLCVNRIIYLLGNIPRPVYIQTNRDSK